MTREWRWTCSWPTHILLWTGRVWIYVGGLVGCLVCLDINMCGMITKHYSDYAIYAVRIGGCGYLVDMNG